ncbi:MAG: DegV family protein, partial [Acidimicrobiales bacterium]
MTAAPGPPATLARPGEDDGGGRHPHGGAPTDAGDSERGHRRGGGGDRRSRALIPVGALAPRRPWSVPMSPENRVTVVTDSAASLPSDPGLAPGVAVVPMTVVLGDEEHADGTLAPGDVLRRIGREAVSTSAPSPGDFLQHIETGGGRPVLVVTVARQMSASYEAAVTACLYTQSASVVVDSGTAAGGQGLVVAAAAHAAAEGRSLEEVAAEARRVAGRVRLMAALERLDQLARSGRVPGIAAVASRSLGLRPLFELASGRAAAR